MSSILEIFFPLCDSDTVRWQRRTPDVEHGEYTRERAVARLYV
ncbi:hypothetical protein R4R33_002811 [Escherichia coli]